MRFLCHRTLFGRKRCIPEHVEWHFKFGNCFLIYCPRCKFMDYFERGKERNFADLVYIRSYDTEQNFIRVANRVMWEEEEE